MTRAAARARVALATALALAVAACGSGPDQRAAAARESAAARPAPDSAAGAAPAAPAAGSDSVAPAGGSTPAVGSRGDTARQRGSAPPARGAPSSTPPPVSGQAPDPARDTARGIVRVAGASPMTRVVLRRSNGPTLELTGRDTAVLRRLGGVEVVVRGSAEAGSRFAVADFTVRAVDGEPALDGVLRRDGEVLVLVTASGPVRLGNPPAPLADLVGARIWIAGPPATGPNPYGVIEPPRR